MIKLLILSAIAISFVHAQDRPIGFASLEGSGNRIVQGGTTGGEKGQTVIVKNFTDLNRYATATEPYVIQVSGTITITPTGTEIKVMSNKTIIGEGNNATISGGGFFVGAGIHNVIFRNLHIQDTQDGAEQDWDGIQLDSAHHVWIDHCSFKLIGDGMIDSRHSTDYVTISWNIFSDHNKTLGIGWTPVVEAHLTIHNNWFRRLVQRNPSCDNAFCHLFNNYLEDLSSYGNYSRGMATMRIENSIFRNVKDPWYYDANAKLTESGNITEGTTSGKMLSNGQGFDPKQFYNYTMGPVSTLKQSLADSAGPQSWVGVAPKPVPIQSPLIHHGRAQNLPTQHYDLLGKQVQKIQTATPD